MAKKAYHFKVNPEIEGKKMDKITAKTGISETEAFRQALELLYRKHFPGKKS